MAKFHGVVGFDISEETSPGVWTGITERSYFGDVIRNARRLDDNQQVNGDIVLNNTISIVADVFANEHFFAIRYVRWMGANWSVTNVEVQHPRLILTIGGVYNGQTAGTA